MQYLTQKKILKDHFFPHLICRELIKKKKNLQVVTLRVPFLFKMFATQNDNNYIFKNIIKWVENSNTIDKV